MTLIRALTIVLMMSVSLWTAEEKFSSTDSTSSEASRVESFDLEQNYPNPFNPSTTIRFSLPTASDVKIEIFDLLGNSVKKLAENRYQAGIHTIKVDASDLSTGVYFYSMTAGDFKAMRRMTLMK